MFNRKCSSKTVADDEEEDEVSIVRKERTAICRNNASKAQPPPGLPSFDVSKINDIIIQTFSEQKNSDEDENEEDILLQKKIQQAKQLRQRKRMSKTFESDVTDFLPEQMDEFELQQIEKSNISSLTATTNNPPQNATFIEIEREKALLGQRIPPLKGEEQIIQLIAEEQEKLSSKDAIEHCSLDQYADVDEDSDVDLVLEEIIKIAGLMSTILSNTDNDNDDFYYKDKDNDDKNYKDNDNIKAKLQEQREKLEYLIEKLKGNSVYERVLKCKRGIDEEIQQRHAVAVAAVQEINNHNKDNHDDNNNVYSDQ